MCVFLARADRIKCTSVYLFLYGESSAKFQPKRTHISWDMNANINKENKKNSGFGEAPLSHHYQ